MMEKSTQLPETWTPPAPPKYVPPALTAVRAGRLFDARAGKMLENQIILIEGERIIDVAPDVPIPAGAKIIDLSHETVLPGLIDTHVHVMDGNPLFGPGGPGVGPNGAGPTSASDRI